MTDITSDQGDVFQDLTPLNNINLLNRACVYTIWTLTSTPDRYNILYIGQTGQAQTRLDQNHHKYQCWQTHNVNGLYVAFLPTPSVQYTESQRRQIETTLIQKYNPVCNN